jgi:hypothetical protein
LKEWPVVSLKVNTSAILQQLAKASPLKGNLEEVSVVGIRCANMELDTIEICAGDVNGISLVTGKKNGKVHRGQEKRT